MLMVEALPIPMDKRILKLAMELPMKKRRNKKKQLMAQKMIPQTLKQTLKKTTRKVMIKVPDKALKVMHQELDKAHRMTEPKTVIQVLEKELRGTAPKAGIHQELDKAHRVMELKTVIHQVPDGARWMMALKETKQTTLKKLPTTLNKRRLTRSLSSMPARKAQ